MAREQGELAQKSAKETTRQRIIAQEQQRLAADAKAEANQQKLNAQHQQILAEESAAEARRQEAKAEDNERKAERGRRGGPPAGGERRGAAADLARAQADQPGQGDDRGRPGDGARAGARRAEASSRARGPQRANRPVTATRLVGDDRRRRVRGVRARMTSSPWSRPTSWLSLWSVANPATPVRSARSEPSGSGAIRSSARTGRHSPS